jgi:indolepyruvate ferredoxin oxidoreductase beta subunit
MQFNVILSGVGGQGILTIAYMLDKASIANAYHFKQAEVHGMAQRGGAIQTHLRISDQPIFSDLIPQATADLIISVEPLEVNRYLSYLKKDGVVVSSSTPVKNIPDYPDEGDLFRHLLSLPNVVLLDAGKIARRAGSSRSQNMVMVGAATPFLPFELEQFPPIIHELFGDKGDTASLTGNRVVEMNITALNLGFNISAFFTQLVEHGLAKETAFALMERFDPETVDPETAAEWAGGLRGNEEQIMQRLAEMEGSLSATQAGLKSLLHPSSR